MCSYEVFKIGRFVLLCILSDMTFLFASIYCFHFRIPIYIFVYNGVLPIGIGFTYVNMM